MNLMMKITQNKIKRTNTWTLTTQKQNQNLHLMKPNQPAPPKNQNQSRRHNPIHTRPLQTKETTFPKKSLLNQINRPTASGASNPSKDTSPSAEQNPSKQTETNLDQPAAAKRKLPTNSPQVDLKKNERHYISKQGQ